MKDIIGLIRTKRVQRWLSNFDESQRRLAIWLLNRLILISEEDFEKGIKKSFEKILNQARKKVAIIIVNDFPQEKGHSPDILSDKIKKIFNTSSRNSRIIFITTQESVADLNAKLSECDIVVLANDIIGTGNQISHFWHGTGKTTRHGKPYSIPPVVRKTIVSKVSRKKLHIMIFSFIIYSTGMKLLIKNTYIRDREENLKPIPFVQEKDFISYVKAIESKGYPASLRKFVKSNNSSSGYRESAAFSVFYYRAPNNLPPIFYNVKNSLFFKNNRKIPREIIPFFGNTQEDYNDLNFLSQSWNPKLLYALERKKPSSNQMSYIIALGLLAKRSGLKKIESYFPNHKQILELLKENELIDANNKITYWGTDFLCRYKNKNKIEFNRGFGDKYIPKFFRGISRF